MPQMTWDGSRQLLSCMLSHGWKSIKTLGVGWARGGDKPQQKRAR